MFYWILFGPVLDLLHTIFSVFVVLRAMHHLSANSAWGSVNALMALALGILLLVTNAAITAFGVAIARNYDEILQFLNQIIRYRIALKGKSSVAVTLRVH